MYDWANSSYLLVITSTVFPIYFNSITRSVFGGEEVLFFDFTVTNTVLYSFSVSAAFLIVAILSPLLSGIADSGGLRIQFLKFFTYLGSASTLSLFWFRGTNVEFGIIMSVLAGIGYSGSLVFYNAFLPEITSEENYDRVSAKGYTYGYIGSVILLLVSFVIIEMHESLGFVEKTSAVRLSFLMVGVWWFSFAQYSFYHLPKGEKSKGNNQDVLLKGFKEIIKVQKLVLRLKAMKRYLLAFFFYSMGVQAIMHLAASFGEKELKMESGKLIATIIIIQLVAIGGAYLFAFISKRFNNGVSIFSMLIIWIGACLFAYTMTSEYEFYGLATVIGLVMGGIQSMSRSTFSKLIPRNSHDNTSFFSFYDVLEKLSIVLGTFSFGFVEFLTGSMRNSILVLTGFFVVGVILFLISGLLKKSTYTTQSVDA